MFSAMVRSSLVVVVLVPVSTTPGTIGWRRGRRRASTPPRRRPLRLALGGTLRPGGDPEAASPVRVLGIRDGRDADEEERVGARGRDAVNRAREARVPLAVDRDVARIELHLGGGVAGIADQRSGDRV